MTDLRKAAEMALKYLENNSPETDALVQVEPHVWEHKGSLVIQALRQALAQPEHEPVAWVIEDGEVDYYVDVVAKIKPGTPLYTAPPKKEWVGLTDEEIKEIVGPWGDTPIKGYTRKLFDQIEAKLKEKNT
jgi:hypothetical protein